MKNKYLLSICCLLFVHMSFSRDYIETATSIRIFKVDAKTLSDLRSAENKEQKLVIIEPGISQEDFSNICSKLRWITKLRIEADNKEISDISAIRSLRSLEVLDIRTLPFAQTSPLDLIVLDKSLNLKELHIQNTAITNTEILQLLPLLEKITFSQAAVSSLSFLEFTKELTDLNLDGTNHTFTDYSAIAHLPKLRNLSIQANSQATNENLLVLQESTTLQSLQISECKHLTSLTFVSNIKTLRDITANNCVNLTNTDGLIPLQQLRNLSFDSSPIQSIAFAENKSRLRDLSISSTQVTDLSHLQNCSSLARLNISKTNITDISALAQLSSLRRLDLSNTPITNTEQIAQLQGVRILDISNTGISEFSSFQQNRQFEEIIFTGTSISDISPLYVLQRIAYLRMPQNIPQTQIEAVRVRFSNIRIDIVE
jgi:hypothetical protein